MDFGKGLDLSSAASLNGANARAGRRRWPVTLAAVRVDDGAEIGDLIGDWVGAPRPPRAGMRLHIAFGSQPVQSRPSGL